MAYDTSTHIASVTIASATVPVSILAPGWRSAGWVMRARSGNSIAILVWPYTGATPNAVPTNVYELTAGNTLNDNLGSSSSGADAGLGDGWAGALASGGSSTVDVIWR